MYNLHRMMQLVEDDSPKSSSDTRLLFGESKRHEVGAEGVLIDSLYDNMLTSLNNRIKGMGNDNVLYHEGVINDSCDLINGELDRFEKACESITAYASNEPVRLYAEAKRGISVKAILARIIAFFKGIPAMLARLLGRITAMYRKLRVRSRYLVNRTEFFQSFNDNRLKSFNENVKFDLDEIKSKHSPWLEQNKVKLDKIKLSGDDNKDYKKILSYIVGWMPVKPYGMTKDNLGKVDDSVMRSVFGDRMVEAVFSLASHAATMDDSNIFMDNSTLQTVESLSSMLDMYLFLDISSQTTQSAFDGTPLAGIHTLFSKHHVYVTKLNNTLNTALKDVYSRRARGNGDESKNSIDKLVSSTKKAAEAVDALKACLSKPTTKRTKAFINLIFVYSHMLQQSLSAILLGNAEDLNDAIFDNMRDFGDGVASGVIPSWGDIKKSIDATKGTTVGYARYIGEYKLLEIGNLMDVFTNEDVDYNVNARKDIDRIATTATLRGTTKSAKSDYNTIIDLENRTNDFIAGYDGKSDAVHRAIDEYVRRANKLHVATVDMTKVTTTLMEIIGMTNNYRMAVIMDLTYRMQTVTDMFGMAKLILEERKANKVSESTSKETGGRRPVNGQLAFNS